MYDMSIIMYVKDSEKYLRESLKGILRQSLDTQIICIYEKSTDDSLLVLNNFSKKYPNVSVKETDDFSTNDILETIKSVESEYILFADSFNIIKDDVLKKFYDKILKDQCDVLLFDLNNLKEDKVIKRISQLVGEKTFTPDKIGEYLPDVERTLYNRIYRKSFLIDQLDLYDMFVQTEDNLALLSLINSQKISLIDDALYKTENHSSAVVDGRSFTQYVNSQNIFLNLFNREEYKGYRTKVINIKFSDIVELYDDVAFKFKKEAFKALRDYCLNYLKERENNIHSFTDENRKRFEQIIISESVEEYELLKKVNEEKKSINFMKRYEKIIKVEHRKIKNFNDNLRNSRSWKLTSIFRLRDKL